MPRIKPNSSAPSPVIPCANRKLVNHSHPDDVVDPGQTARKHRIVSVNLNENPLSWLHARGLLTDRQLAAGDRLRTDYNRAGLMPNVSMNWNATPPDGGSRAGRAHGSGTIVMIDAKARFHAAMAAVGPGLADICWRVICGCEAMTLAERALGWPSRAGRIVLTLALDRLADHYCMR